MVVIMPSLKYNGHYEQTLFSNERRAQVVSCLVEGNSIRATVRITGVAKNTIVKLLTELGQACNEYQDATLRNLDCKVIDYAMLIKSAAMRTAHRDRRT